MRCKRKKKKYDRKRNLKASKQHNERGREIERKRERKRYCGQEATWELVRSMCSAGYPDRVRTINLTMRIKTFNTVKETGVGGGGAQSMGKRFEKKIYYVYLFILINERKPLSNVH
ncbi:hypothetical protein QTP88_012978 [Uroleucon formosanum]